MTDAGVGLDPGRYVALLSHSGSRGAGAQVADHYSKLARAAAPGAATGVVAPGVARSFNGARPAILGGDGVDGPLCGSESRRDSPARRPSARRRCFLDVENHHNFAWRERHGLPNGSEDELIVHRKGATPAGEGVLGIIPGSMGTPGYVVRGKGVAAALNSASHGAGRRMSRKKAKETFSWDAVQEFLRERNVTLISAGLDEVPMAYKDIDAVMAAQRDLGRTAGTVRAQAGQDGSERRTSGRLTSSRPRTIGVGCLCRLVVGRVSRGRIVGPTTFRT